MPVSQSYVFDPLGLGAAEGLLSRGGGQYGPRVRCHDCGHEWYAPGHAARQQQAEADFARRLREFDEHQQRLRDALPHRKYDGPDADAS